MNDQRNVIYSQRKDILQTKHLSILSRNFGRNYRKYLRVYLMKK